MNKQMKYISVKRGLIFCMMAWMFCQCNTNAQVTVGVDNWFNHEINAKTGQLYHYLWTDSAFSGYSRWGAILTKKGAKLATIDHQPDATSLSKLDVFVIVDPDTTTENPNPNYIMPEDIKNIEVWVKNGGVLVFLANDAPNCEFTHLNNLSSRFGIIFNHVTLHPVTAKMWDMGAFTSFPAHPMFKGLSKIYLKEISSLTLSKPATAILTEKGEVFMAESRVGKGLVIAIGDPWIYNEYIDHDRLPADFQNHEAAENLSDYLISNCKKKTVKK